MHLKEKIEALKNDKEIHKHILEAWEDLHANSPYPAPPLAPWFMFKLGWLYCYNKLAQGG